MPFQLKTDAEKAKMTPAQRLEYLETLEAENMRMQEENKVFLQTNTLRMKVAEKGGISVYGLGTRPVTLYKTQWIRLLDFIKAPEDSPIRVFIRENESRLAVKPTSNPAPSNPAPTVDPAIAALQAQLAALTGQAQAKGPGIS